jgi:chaperonin GroES
MTIEPLDDRVLVEVDDGSAPQVTSGGIYLPDTAKEKPRIGTVLAVGTDEDLREKVKIGDRILYGKYTGDEVELDHKKVLLLQRNEILALVRG